MRAVVQRVSRAEVRVDGGSVSSIGPGLLVLLGVGEEDREADARYLAGKCVELRIFPDEQGKMNRSVQEAEGAVIVVSQFTLLGDVRKGRRPSYAKAAQPDQADQLYGVFVADLRSRGIDVGTGVFGAMMDVELVNDGPVTILLDSAKTF